MTKLFNFVLKKFLFFFATKENCICPLPLSSVKTFACECKVFTSIAFDLDGPYISQTAIDSPQSLCLFPGNLDRVIDLVFTNSPNTISDDDICSEQKIYSNLLNACS